MASPRPVVSSNFDIGGRSVQYLSSHPEGNAPETGILAGRDEFFQTATPVGEQAKINIAESVSDLPTGDVQIVGQSGTVVRDLPDYQGGRYHQWTPVPNEPGRYQVLVGGESIGPLDVGVVEGATITDTPYRNFDGGDGGEIAAPPDDETEPEDVPGVVNADNPEGAALAPSLRESLGNIGGTVNIGDESMTVGPVTDADELLSDGGNAGASDGSGILGGIGILAALAAVVWVVFG